MEFFSLNGLFQLLGNREPPTQDRVDVQRLLGANHRDHADRALLVLFEPADGADECRHLERLGLVDLVDRLGAPLDVVGDQVRFDLAR